LSFDLSEFLERMLSEFMEPASREAEPHFVVHDHNAWGGTGGK
jgi:hypothetical protein